MSRQLAAIAEAIADREDLDWSAVDVSTLDALGRARFEELRAVAEISRCIAALTTSALRERRSPDFGDLAAGGVTVWGDLTIRECVGHGRFGDVYRAWDPAIERDVALKLLRGDSDEHRTGAIVIHEARLMARVRHPNVATIYGAARRDGKTGLWMEFIEGRNLHAEVQDRGRLEAADAALVGVELCRALSAVHDAGLVHRDLKAQNVMREGSGRIVLGDFGTGLEVDDNAGSAQLAGTPLYLAPEMWQRQPATPQSDLYSLGVLLFHLVTGTFPVAGRSIAEIRRAHASGVRRALTDLRHDLPRAFVDAVERALSPDPAARFTNAREMEGALTPIVARSSSDQGSANGSRSRRRRTLSVALLTIAVVSIGIFAVPRVGRLLRLAAAPPANGPSSRQLGPVPAPSGQFWGQPAPDGRTFSFVDMGGDLGVFDVTSGEVRILTDRQRTGGSAYQHSTFSPDGKRIAYAWETAEGLRELRIITVESRASEVRWQSREEIPHPIDWSQADGRMLLLFEKRDGRRSLGLIAENAAITMLGSVSAGFSTARLSPDARHVVFDDLQRPDGTDRGIFITDVDRPNERRPLIAASSEDFGPLWIPGEGAVLFISDRTGEPSVWSVPMRDGGASGAPSILHRNIGRIVPNGVTMDGTLHYTLQVGLVDMYEAPIDGPRDAAGEPSPIAPEHVGSKANPDWSPDGTRIVYVALPHAGTGAPNTRRLAILDRATGATRLLDLPLSFYLIPRWSPDGRMILIKGIDLQSRRGLYLVDLQSGETRAAALVDERTPAEIGSYQWGATAATVMFVRQSVGLFELDIATGRERLLFDFKSEGISGMLPMPGFGLSRDGQRLAYAGVRKTAAGKNETVLRVKTLGQPARDLVSGTLQMGDWAPDGRILFTRSEGGQRTSLWSVDGAGGNAAKLGVEMVGLRNVNIDPAGKRIAFTAGFPGTEVWKISRFLPAPGRK